MNMLATIKIRSLGALTGLLVGAAIAIGVPVLGAIILVVLSIIALVVAVAGAVVGAVVVAAPAAAALGPLYGFAKPSFLRDLKTTKKPPEIPPGRVKILSKLGNHLRYARDDGATPKERETHLAFAQKLADKHGITEAELKKARS